MIDRTRPKLDDLIRDARKELRKAEGLPLSADEQIKEMQKAADELKAFILRVL